MINTFKIDLNNAPNELTAGLQAIARNYPRRFFTTDVNAAAIPLTFRRQTELPGPQVTGNGQELTVCYRRSTDVYRALGRLLGVEPGNANALTFSETSSFDTMGLMLDVSRNGVFLTDTIEKLLVKSALMGLNMFMLYTEDTYEVPDEPFFGYLRGRYTQDELRALDQYAGALGIEMVPCIQTLGHMEQMLQWPAYAAYRDTDKVLLAEQPETYALLEKIIAAAMAPYTSKRIHIGMDEAHGIGTGVYRKKFGEKPAFDILNQHLARVREICAAQHLKPMIWSDMYFRLGSKTNGYYDPETVIPPEIIANIPRDVQLVYWDYYHHDTAFYKDWIARHRTLGSDPVMAGGIYTWDRFWTALPWSFSAENACLTACKETGLREVFMTMWGDNGAEVNLFSALPGIQYFAEHCYTLTAPDPGLMRANFKNICNAHFDDYVRASELDSPAYLRRDVAYGTASNLSKALLWQDPALAIIDPQLTDAPRLAQHYRELAEKLRKAADAGAGNTRLHQPALLAAILAIKVTLRAKLADACRAADRATTQKIAATELPELRRLVEQLWRMHRASWMQHRKPFGWEAIERRYGGLSARLDCLAERLADYNANRLDDIPELTAQLEPIWPELNERINVRYPRLAGPSCIA